MIIPLLQSNKLGAQLEDIAAKAGLAADWLQKDFKATAGSICPLYSSQTKAKWILLGLGETTSLSFIEQAFRKLSFHHQDLLEPQIGLWHQYAAEGEGFDPEVYAMGSISGLLLGCYQIGAFKTNEKTTHPLKKRGARVSLIGPEAKSMSAAARRGKATAETQVRILDLVNGPANKIKPESLAKWAVQSGKAHDFKVKVFNKAQIQKTGLHALMAVNQGSDYPPQFIIMEYKPKGRSAKNLPKVGLVGKGVTFDTGGLSIKGSVNMHYMKSDMGGAAAVLGAMELTAKLKLPVHLIGIVPTTDNCVDAKAVKPGDVINSYDGQTIEVIDTDAEGRLILADGLAYMNKHYKPDIMIDLATLTGNCVRALGYHAGGLFTNNDDLSEKLTTAGQACGERLWRLPIWDDYRCEIESEVADVRNLSLRPVAGAITAAKFLEVFTAKHPCWAHLDIAGVAFGSHSFSKQKSATAFGVKLLVEMLRRL
ncbi:MAG: leucyl aminopeptidase family protein [Bacteroidota bacterium]